MIVLIKVVFNSVGGIHWACKKYNFTLNFTKQFLNILKTNLSIYWLECYVIICCLFFLLKKKLIERGAFSSHINQNEHNTNGINITFGDTLVFPRKGMLGGWVGELSKIDWKALGLLIFLSIRRTHCASLIVFLFFLSQKENYSFLLR